MPSAIVPCVAWVPKGKAQQHPTKVTMGAEELKAMVARHKIELDEVLAREGGEKMDDVEDGSEDDELAEYGLDNYDDEEDGLAGEDAGAEYITLENQKFSDDEDEEIKAEDSLLVVGKVADDMSSLEVMVYNEEEGSEYVHHDQMLETFPLCLEWMDFSAHLDDPQQREGCRGNVVATGGMLPCIEIWDLDVVDSLEPACRLGSRKKLKKKKGQGHSDAILDLAWNRNARHLLASASADGTVILWDLRTHTCAHTLTGHNDKVQSVAWNPVQANSLLSGGMDGTVQLYDFLNAENGPVRSWKVSGEVETLLWNHFEPSQFLVSCDDGFIYCMDARQAAAKPLYSLSAHSKAVNAIALSYQIPGALATVSSDKELKLWDISTGQPACVLSRSMKMGELLSAAFCYDTPLTLAVGGQKQGIRVINLLENAGVRSRFGNKQRKTVQGPGQTPPVAAATAHVDMEDEQAAGGGASSSSAAAAASANARKAKKPKHKKSKHKKR